MKLKEKVVGQERLGIYQCDIWKTVRGSRITYRWVDEDGMKRMEICHSTRPAVIQYSADGERPYVRYRGERLKLDEFMILSRPRKLGKRTFTHSSSDTMFSGYYIDVPEDGEVAFIARAWS